MGRVCINGKFLAQPLTGVQRAAGELLHALDAALDEAPDLGTDRPVQDWCVALPPGVAAPAWRRLRPLTVPAPAGLRSLHAWEQLALPRAARGALLVCLSGSAPWARPRATVAMLHDAAVFDHPQAYTPLFRAWYRLLFARLGAQARGLLTPSAHSAARLAARLHQPPARFERLPLGADHLDRVAPEPAAAETLGLAPGQPFLLAVGSRNPTKNLARVEQAFARVAAGRPDLQLLVVGDTRPAVFQGAADPAPHPRIRRLGRVDDARLLALYRQAAALVFPSLEEGFGLPPLEAMRAGCPVLVSACGALPEVCGDAGLVVDPHSVDAIAGGIARLLDDAALAAAQRAAGQAQAARWRWADAGRRLRARLEAWA